MQNNYDKIICHGLTYDCELGFHDHEKAKLQKIKIDITAYVEPINNDDTCSIKFNYFEANKLVGSLLKETRFNLIETVGNKIAEILLAQFKISLVNVRVTKFPKDMTNLESVTFECERARD